MVQEQNFQTSGASAEIERKKNIAQEIYQQIGASLNKLATYYGPESDHSLVRELRGEEEMARRALVSLGVEVL